MIRVDLRIGRPSRLREGRTAHQATAFPDVEVVEEGAAIDTAKDEDEEKADVGLEGRNGGYKGCDSESDTESSISEYLGEYPSENILQRCQDSRFSEMTYQSGFCL